MTFSELYEQDKDRLLADLEGACDPVRAQAVLGAELDRLLFRYNEHCEDDREREAASCMMQTARMALTLTDSAGEVKIWEQRTYPKAEKKGASPAGLPLVLLAAGIVCAVLVLAIAVGRSDRNLMSILTMAALLAGACGGTWTSARLSGKQMKDAESSCRTEVLTDPQKLFRGVRNVLLPIDRNLADIRSASGWEKRLQAGQASRLEGRTLELCASLLEAEASGDGEYALERLDDVKYFLHEKGIETVQYGKGNEDWFDLLPGTKAGTIRPALTEDGVLLRKGLAVGGR